MNKILVIAPHPDDEVLGCGATLSRHKQLGDEVFLCIVTKPYGPDWSKGFIKNRREEIRRANKILGIKQTFSLGLPTVKLDAVPQKKLNDRIKKIVEKVVPEILYVPFNGDLNKDHRLVFEAALVAARPVAKSSIKKILAYETLSETEWGIKPFLPNLYVDVAKNIERKVQAMQAYGTELRKYPHPRSLEIIKALARKRGSEAGLKFAEAFVLIREIAE